MTLSRVALAHALFLSVGCGTSQVGIHEAFSARVAHVLATSDASGLRFTRNNGDEVLITRAYLNLSAVELMPCPTVTWRDLLRALSPMGTAYAHSTTSPTRLGDPHVISALRAPTNPLALGELHPAPGHYCSVRLSLEAADDDAEGLPGDVDMVGKTLWFEATVTPAGGAPSLIQVTETGSQEQDLSIPETTLEASTPEGAQTIVLEPEHWLDGVDLTTGSGAQILQRITASASIE